MTLSSHPHGGERVPLELPVRLQLGSPQPPQGRAGGAAGQGGWALAAGEPMITGSRWAKRARLAPLCAKAWESHASGAPAWHPKAPDPQSGRLPPHRCSEKPDHRSSGRDASVLLPFVQFLASPILRAKGEEGTLKSQSPLERRCPPHLAEGSIEIHFQMPRP